MVTLNELKKDKVFYFFSEISNIPRASGKEKAISDYLVEFANDREFYVRQDSMYNIVMKKPATKGYEDAPTVIIQGHLDMVCEKNEGTIHDFDVDPLKLVVNGDVLKAEGTTLGADNGIAIAYALAVFDSKELPHPALEMVMTTDEEVGLTGALNMTVEDIEGQYFINLDSEEEGEFVVSCAGGLRALFQLPVAFQTMDAAKYKLVELMIKGLKGGHSGMEIDKNRANATLVLGRVISLLSDDFDLKITEINGGMKDNVIPRESSAKILVPLQDLEAVQTKLNQVTDMIKDETLSSDPGFHVVLNQQEITGDIQAFTDEASENLLFILNITPNGVQSMSPDIPGLVESSLNLGRLYRESNQLTFEFATRSSVRSKKHQMVRQLQLIAKKCGATCIETKQYPEWPLKKNSMFLEKCVETYEQMVGKKPMVKGIHAGLESGVFLEKLPHLDAISFGPNVYDVHSPDEWISISSVNRTWEFLIELLKNIK